MSSDSLVTHIIHHSTLPTHPLHMVSRTPGLTTALCAACRSIFHPLSLFPASSSLAFRYVRVRSPRLSFPLSLQTPRLTVVRPSRRVAFLESRSYHLLCVPTSIAPQLPTHIKAMNAIQGNAGQTGKVIHTRSWCHIVCDMTRDGLTHCLFSSFDSCRHCTI